MGAATLVFTVAFSVATAVHYFLNRFWALPSDRKDKRQQFGEYLFTVLVSYLVNIGIFSLCLKVLEMSPLLAALCAVPPATFVVFLLLNYRVFSQR